VGLAAGIFGLRLRLVIDVVSSRLRDLGGFEVRRVLPAPRTTDRFVGPFCFFDHMGPMEFAHGAPRSADVRPHPHIGLSTLTYLFDGEIVHRDSLGSLQPIRAGDTNWMVAGRGITHSERFEAMRETGGRVHGVQSWLALPEDVEETEPSFEHHDASALPHFGDKGIQGRVIAGEAFGLSAPGRAFSPMFYLHLQMDEGARLSLDRQYAQRAIYVVTGEVEVDGHRHAPGRMLLFASDDDASFTATQSSIVLALGGEPIGPRFMEWNFVSSRKERIDQAKADWRAGRLELPVGDDREFVPLPGDPEPASPSS
jgi:redox-sensitive bicupin YhaK (pirin superfamily)